MVFKDVYKITQIIFCSVTCVDTYIDNFSHSEFQCHKYAIVKYSPHSLSHLCIHINRKIINTTVWDILNWLSKYRLLSWQWAVCFTAFLPHLFQLSISSIWTVCFNIFEIIDEWNHICFGITTVRNSYLSWPIAAVFTFFI